MDWDTINEKTIEKEAKQNVKNAPKPQKEEWGLHYGVQMFDNRTFEQDWEKKGFSGLDAHDKKMAIGDFDAAFGGLYYRNLLWYKNMTLPMTLEKDAEAIEDDRVLLNCIYINGVKAEEFYADKLNLIADQNEKNDFLKCAVSYEAVTRRNVIELAPEGINERLEPKDRLPDEIKPITPVIDELDVSRSAIGQFFHKLFCALGLKRNFAHDNEKRDAEYLKQFENGKEERHDKISKADAVLESAVNQFQKENQELFDDMENNPIKYESLEERNERVSVYDRHDIAREGENEFRKAAITSDRDMSSTARTYLRGSLDSTDMMRRVKEELTKEEFDYTVTKANDDFDTLFTRSPEKDEKINEGLAKINKGDFNKIKENLNKEIKNLEKNDKVKSVKYENMNPAVIIYLNGKLSSGMNEVDVVRDRQGEALTKKDYIGRLRDVADYCDKQIELKKENSDTKEKVAFDDIEKKELKVVKPVIVNNKNTQKEMKQDSMNRG